MKLSDVLNEEQLTQLDNYILNYKQFTQTVEQFQKVNIKPPFNAAEFEKALIDLQLATGQISVDPFERTPEEIANHPKSHTGRFLGPYLFKL